MGAHNPRKETILVTGGAGFIGSHLARELLTKNHRVLSLDLRGAGPTPVPGVTYLRGDAREQLRVGKLLRDYDVTAVYHLAATVSVPLCQNDPVESYSNNVNATLAVLDATRGEIQRRANEREETALRIAFASSAALYGELGNHQRPLKEDRIADRFRSFYAAQKHASEKMIELYCDFFSVPALIFRFFNVYGQGQDPTSPYSGVITVFSKLAREGKTLPLNDGGIQTRDFIPVSELVGAITAALDLPREKWNALVLNLGSGVRTSVRELAEMIRKIARSESEITSAPPRPGDVLHSLANIQRAKNILGFAPSVPLSSKLGELLEANTPSHTPAVNAPPTLTEKTPIPLAPERLHPPASFRAGL